MLQLSQIVWTLRFSVWVVFNKFLLLDATDRLKIRRDQKRLFFAVSLYPLSFWRTLPLKKKQIQSSSYISILWKLLWIFIYNKLLNSMDTHKHGNKVSIDLC